MSQFFTLLSALLILFLAGCQEQPLQRTYHPTSSTPAPQAAAASSLPPTATPPPETELPYPYPPKTTPTDAPYQPPVVGSPPPTQTLPNYTPTPTFAAVLMQPLTFTPPAGLPPGAAIQVFEVGRPVEPGGWGYTSVLDILKEKSFFYRQGQAYGNAEWVAEINQALSPFNYQVKQSPDQRYKFSLYQGDHVLLDQVRLDSRVSVNRSRTDFVLFVEKLPLGGYYMVRKNGLVELPVNQSGFGEKQYRPEGWPQFFGEDLMYPRIEYDRATNSEYVKVYQND